MGTEEYMKMAQSNENMCAQEVEQALRKYNCTIHYQQAFVDGQVVNAGIFFKFNPNMMMGQQKKLAN